MILGYWPLKARIHTIRYLLAYLEVSYKEVNLTIDQWKEQKDKIDLNFPDLPYLIDGETKLT